MRSLLRLVSLVVLLVSSTVAQCAETNSQTIRLASLEWPPYMGSELPQNGLSAVVAQAVIKKMGRHVEIDYFPWARAMLLGGTDPRYEGYFPSYYTDERATHCHFSAPVGVSTLGLAYLKDAPMQWNSIEDLSNKNLAVVNGYSNGKELDAAIAQGKQKSDISPTDLHALRKLILHRVDAVVIDKLVLRYLLATEPSIKPMATQIEFHSRPLAELTLHVCFKPTAEGLALQRDFDIALRGLNLHKIENEYFKSLSSSAAHDQPDVR